MCSCCTQGSPIPSSVFWKADLLSIKTEDVRELICQFYDPSAPWMSKILTPVTPLCGYVISMGSGVQFEFI